MSLHHADIQFGYIYFTFQPVIDYLIVKLLIGERKLLRLSLSFYMNVVLHEHEF